MTKAVWTKFITDNAGAVVEGASVTVFLSDGITPATIYSDPAGTSKANPFLTPAGGKAEFYADPGIYVIQASKDGKTATWNNEEIGHARRDLDLSDLKSAANARNNLGLKSAALADIVGTVSQSGGVPTGAVIERGSNANGEYTKLADGTLICYVRRQIGGAFGPPAEVSRTWTFPASFSELPVVRPIQYGGLESLGTGVAQVERSISNTTVVVRVKNNTNIDLGTGGYNIEICSAIGRWY